MNQGPCGDELCDPLRGGGGTAGDQSRGRQAEGAGSVPSEHGRGGGVKEWGGEKRGLNESEAHGEPRWGNSEQRVAVAGGGWGGGEERRQRVSRGQQGSGGAASRTSAGGGRGIRWRSSGWRRTGDGKE